MYLGVWRSAARKPAPLLGATQKCARKVSKSGQVLGACPQVSSPETDVRLGHSIGTILCMVASGLGVSVLPDGALRHPYSNDLISVIPFSPSEPSRRIALAWRVGFVRPKAIDALLAAVHALTSPAYHLLD